LSNSGCGTHDLETNFVVKASLVGSRESMCFCISSGTFMMFVDDIIFEHEKRRTSTGFVVQDRGIDGFGREKGFYFTAQFSEVCEYLAV
jgi:hypothetical protein